MKKYIYFLAVAFLAVAFQSCSKSDDNQASTNELQQNPQAINEYALGLFTLSRGDILDGIESGEIYGGLNTAPVEGKSFYAESKMDIIMISALGTFTTIDHNDNVETRQNIGGAVQTKDGGTFTVTSKGKGLHIEGSGTTTQQIYDTHISTRISLDIDDASLLKSGKATITALSLSSDSEMTIFGSTISGSQHLTAEGIPMESYLPMLAKWKGGSVTGYTYHQDEMSMTLVESPANYIEVWIGFNNGTTAKARVIY